MDSKRRHYLENKETYNRHSREHYYANKEKYLERAKIWRKENPDKVNTFNKRWRDKNPDKTKAIRIKSRYGLSTEQLEKLRTKQNNCCAICLDETDLHIDHDHTTGQIRGLLCGSCNKGIGLLKDDINNLENAIIYLRQKVT